MQTKIIRFNLFYFLTTLLIFAIEAGIAYFVHDRFVRPYLGDVLVVILIYCFARTFIEAGVGKVAFSVLIFAVIIECLQYINFISLLGLEKSKLACVVLGNSFSWQDILAYITGMAIILVAEKFVRRDAL